MGENGTNEGYIVLTLVAEPAEEGGFVSRCPELDISSQGEHAEEAFSMLREAIDTFISALHEIKDLDRFLKERGIKVHRQQPEKKSVDVAPGEIVSTLVASVGRLIPA